MTNKQDIYEALMEAREELMIARNNFDNAEPEDFDVVNAYLNYCEKRFSSLNMKYRALSCIA